MEILVRLLAMAALSTAEICADPMIGGVEEPQFCRFYSRQEVSTPYFSITVEPDFLVGVDRDGRRLLISSSLFKKQDYLSIEVLEGSSLPDWPDCPEETQRLEEGLEWHECRITLEGALDARMAASSNDKHVLIQYGHSGVGAVSATALGRMVQSLHINAI